MAFLNDEQQSLAHEVAVMLTDRGQTVAVAEGTAGGLISAALLWVPGHRATTRAARCFTRLTHASC